MSDLQPASMRVRIEATSVDVDALRGCQPFAVARAVTSGARQGETLVLVRGSFASGSEAVVSRGDCLQLAKDVDAARAILALPLASVLAVWESTSLELGEVAVWTAGSPLSALAGQTAVWRGACPGIELGPATAVSEKSVTGCDYVDWSDAEAAMQRLTALTSGRPGFVAVDLSGRADVIDTLLEVMPSFGRLVLAGPPGGTVTLDFYKNIHRKGAVIYSTLVEPALAFDGDAGSATRAQIPRALEILRNPAMASRCQALIGTTTAAPVATAG